LQEEHKNEESKPPRKTYKTEEATSNSKNNKEQTTKEYKSLWAYGK